MTDEYYSPKEPVLSNTMTIQGSSNMKIYEENVNKLGTGYDRPRS